MDIKKRTPPDYNGQPRSSNGRFGRGKQNGSRSKGRNLGARTVAGVWSLPPILSPKPSRRPGEKPPTIGA